MTVSIQTDMKMKLLLHLVVLMLDLFLTHNLYENEGQEGQVMYYDVLLTHLM